MTSTRTSSMGGAQHLASGRGYTVLNVHNASGQAPEEEGPGSC